MCYSHFGNGVCNGSISITQQDFTNDYYKANSVGQWGKKIMINAVGSAHTVGQDYSEKGLLTISELYILSF